MEFITSGNRIATENFSIGKIYTVTFTNGNYFINTCIGIGPDFVMFQQEAPKMLFCLDMESAETVSTIDESGGGSGTNNYNELNNKPSINGVTLIGNKTAADLSILPVPIVGENDNNKVLTASYSGGVGSYSWQPASGSGTTDYTQLTNKPQINSVELNGNKSLADLGIASAEALAGKQDALSSSQLAAVNSGITSALVTQIGTNTSAIAGKQDALSSSQLQAVNSGITSALVTQIGTNTSAIAGKQDVLSSSQLAAVNSGITSALVTQIGTNQTDILTKQDKTSVKYINTTIGTTYGNPSGMFWTVPAKSIVRLSASIHGDGTNYPDGILITFSTSAAYANPENVLAKYEPTGNELNLSISTIYPRPADTSYTLWLYVKGKASAEYKITYTMDILDTFE